jgi:hypothetical protein
MENGRLFAYLLRKRYFDTIVLGFIEDFVIIGIMSPFRILSLSAICLVFFQSPPSANVGIPMMWIGEMILILLLIPMVIMESVVMARIPDKRRIFLNSPDGNEWDDRYLSKEQKTPKLLYTKKLR